MSAISWYGTSNATTIYPTITTSGGTYYPPQTIYGSPQLPGVLESPSQPLGDREWLDAQIAEVCDLAVLA